MGVVATSSATACHDGATRSQKADIGRGDGRRRREFWPSAKTEPQPRSSREVTCRLSLRRVISKDLDKRCPLGEPRRDGLSAQAFFIHFYLFGSRWATLNASRSPDRLAPGHAVAPNDSTPYTSEQPHTNRWAVLGIVGVGSRCSVAARAVRRPTHPIGILPGVDSCHTELLTPPATVPLVEIAAVDVTYRDGLRAVEGVSFSLRAGEFVAVVGPSGCGKSTLLRSIAGLIRPSRGRLTVAGLEPVRARREATRMSFVFPGPDPPSLA